MSSLHNELFLSTAMSNVGSWVLEVSIVVSCNGDILLYCLFFTGCTTVNTFFGGIDYIAFKLGNYIIFSVW